MEGIARMDGWLLFCFAENELIIILQNLVDIHDKIRQTVKGTNQSIIGQMSAREKPHWHMPWYEQRNHNFVHNNFIKQDQGSKGNGDFSFAVACRTH